MDYTIIKATASSDSKWCSKCKSTKAINLFGTRKANRSGISAWCKECFILYSRKWYADNKDKAHEIRVANYAKHRQERLAYSADYRIKNKDIVQQKSRDWGKANKEKVAACGKLRRSNNKDKHALYKANRRAQQLRATPAWVDKELMELVYSEAEHRGLIVDHIVPLAGKNVCGLHVYYNTQLLSVGDNSVKGNRWPYEPKVPL